MSSGGPGLEAPYEKRFGVIFMLLERNSESSFDMSVFSAIPSDIIPSGFFDSSYALARARPIYANIGEVCVRFDSIRLEIMIKMVHF